MVGFRDIGIGEGGVDEDLAAELVREGEEGRVELRFEWSAVDEGDSGGLGRGGRGGSVGAETHWEALLECCGVVIVAVGGEEGICSHGGRGWCDAGGSLTIALSFA